MIRFVPMLAIFAVMCFTSIGVNSDLPINQKLLQRLKNVEGYQRLYEMHPLLYYKNPKEAIIEQFVKDIDFSNWRYSLEYFKQLYFEKACTEIYKLYKGHKEYFDQLPTVDVNPDANLMCRLGLVVRDCNMYLTSDFLNDVYIDLLRRVIINLQQQT